MRRHLCLLTVLQQCQNVQMQTVTQEWNLVLVKKLEMLLHLFHKDQDNAALC